MIPSAFIRLWLRPLIFDLRRTGVLSVATPAVAGVVSEVATVPQERLCAWVG